LERFQNSDVHLALDGNNEQVTGRQLFTNRNKGWLTKSPPPYTPTPHTWSSDIAGNGLTVQS
jgi:hypothetical protein